MRPSLKGALLSGLIFPGLGQIVLKRYQRGAVLIAAVLISMTIIVVEAVRLALIILAQIEAEGGPIDIGTVSAAAARASTASSSLTINGLFAVILGCWIFAIIDAYRIGKKTDGA
jgi:hypothetical protein